MTPYYIREAGTNRIHGIFWADNIAALWMAVDEMDDPGNYEYAKPRKAGGLWHSLRMGATVESRPGTEELDYYDRFIIHPVGDECATSSAEELCGISSLKWLRFTPHPPDTRT